MCQSKLHSYIDTGEANIKFESSSQSSKVFTLKNQKYSHEVFKSKIKNPQTRSKKHINVILIDTFQRRFIL